MQMVENIQVHSACHLRGLCVFDSEFAFFIVLPINRTVSRNTIREVYPVLCKGSKRIPLLFVQKYDLPVLKIEGERKTDHNSLRTPLI